MNKQTLDDLSKVFSQAEQEFAAKREQFWSSLSEEAQLLVFCAVVQRLTQGEIKEERSYRGILYGTFGFKEDSYIKAQMSGFLELHNSINVSPGDPVSQIQKALKIYGIEDTYDNIAQKVFNKKIVHIDSSDTGE